MGKLRPTNVVAQRVRVESGFKPRQTLWSRGLYAKPLAQGGGKTGKWEAAGPSAGYVCFLQGEGLCVPFLSAMDKGPGMQSTHIISSLNLSSQHLKERLLCPIHR